MTYTSLYYYVIVLALLPFYYIIPRKFRYIPLLAGSLYFYYQFCLGDIPLLLLFAFSLAVSYGAGLRLPLEEDPLRRKQIFWAAIGLAVLPLLLVKLREFAQGIGGDLPFAVLAPVGVSFYSLQMAAYLADIYQGRLEPVRNPFHYTLFASYFPQIIQGPIPRYKQLGTQFEEGPLFDDALFHEGVCQIIWGFFLKFMIADKAGVLVNAVYARPDLYGGAYVWMAGILYSIQLYTDFMSCVMLAKGVSGLFGVRITDNFCRPYFARSVQDFWRRWHISLSSWLRDYIYFPLGGSRKGMVRTYLNIVAVFAVSGFWHGGSPKFLFWGLLHAFYQICGKLTWDLRNKALSLVHIDPESLFIRMVRALFTSFLVMEAWIIFRADTLTQALNMIRSMFTLYNPWVLLDGSVYALGLDARDCLVLAASILTLFAASLLGSRFRISSWICRQQLPVRWLICIGAILVIALMGTYGYGYEAQAFIYGGF